MFYCVHKEVSVLPEYWDVYDAKGNKLAGRRSVRGKHDLGYNEYHLVVYVWIINDKNEIIISKRQKGRTFENSWECTGGCALCGDTSLSAALREVNEELGLTLDAKKGELFKRYLRNYPPGAKAICDVWVFRQNFEESQFKIQLEEVSEARIVSAAQLRELISESELKSRYPYLEKLLEKYCK